MEVWKITVNIFRKSFFSPDVALYDWKKNVSGEKEFKRMFIKKKENEPKSEKERMKFIL